MSELIADLDSRIVDDNGREYFANVMAEPVGDAWEAWLEFVPTDASEPLLTPTETHQSTRDAVEQWVRSVDDIYLEGAFRRATASDGGAVGRLPFAVPVDTVITPDMTAPLDPFAMYAAHGKEGLRVQLRPLTRAELLTVIDEYDLDPAGVSLARLTNAQLVTFIATAVEVQRQQGRQ